MKSSIGTVWITGLVITFMLIFTGYLAVTINYSTAIKSRNYILSIIENKNGITSKNGKPISSTLRSDKQVYYGYGSLQTINLFLRGNAYKQKGSCGEGYGDARGNSVTKPTWYGVKKLYDNELGNDGSLHVSYEKVKDNKEKYYYCFTKIKVDNTPGNLPAYYRIRLFYALDLPILDTLTFTIDGRTNIIDKPNAKEITEFRNS